MTDGPKVLFVSPVPFNGLRQRHQGIAEEFRRNGFPVIFLDPLESPGFSIRESRRENIRVVSIRVPFRSARYPWLHEVAVRFAGKLLLKGKFVAPENSILWIADPGMAQIADFHWKCRFYDRCDRHGTFPGQNLEKWQSYERRLFKKVDHAFASSEVLLREAEALGAANASLLPNAASGFWMHPANSRRQPTPPFRVVSSGAHYEWIDFSWLSMLARNPDVELNLAGTGRGRAFEDLIGNPDVKWHQTLDHSRLRDLFDECHIGVVPFRDMPLTQAVDPVKIYEYAARNLAVWVPSIEGLSNHPLTDTVITDENSLNEALNNMRKDFSFQARKEKIPTWKDRFETISPFLPR